MRVSILTKKGDYSVLDMKGFNLQANHSLKISHNNQKFTFEYADIKSFDSDDPILNQLIRDKMGKAD